MGNQDVNFLPSSIKPFCPDLCQKEEYKHNFMKNSNFSVFNIGFKDVEAFFSFKKIKQLYDIPDSFEWSDVKVILKVAKFKRHKAKSFLIEVGEDNKNIYFIFKGLVRAYHVNEKGEEITALLFKENQFFFCSDVILLQQASQFYYECLEPTYVGCLDFEQAQQVLSANRKLE
ncbi:MAG: cyclic nucleotide-binding domain-containing protein, partial [Bacteroidota bacterium]